MQVKYIVMSKIEIVAKTFGHDVYSYIILWLIVLGGLCLI